MSLIPPTEMLEFACDVNPKIKLREKQLNDGMIWFAMYDDDILSDVLKMKIAYCKQNILPSQLCSYIISDMEVCLASKSCVFIRKCEKSTN